VREAGTVEGPVLLVEDDQVLADILERYLDAHGYDLRIAGSAEEAADLLDRGLQPRVVILDVNLPGDTGWSLLRNPSLSGAGSPPVVIASATTVSPRRLREHGAAGYLPKPFALETLMAVVARLTRSDAPITEDQ
jgi:DNA-binding response OmpR family regulator